MSLAVLAFVCGRSHGGFDRFMYHPILSWLPLDRWGVVESDRATAVLSPRFPDKQCAELATEQTEYLDRSELDDDDLQKIFTLTYRDCVKMEHNH
jgi:hypothetical protein